MVFVRSWLIDPTSVAGAPQNLLWTSASVVMIVHSASDTGCGVTSPHDGKGHLRECVQTVHSTSLDLSRAYWSLCGRHCSQSNSVERIGFWAANCRVRSCIVWTR